MGRRIRQRRRTLMGGELRDSSKSWPTTDVKSSSLQYLLHAAGCEVLKRPDRPPQHPTVSGRFGVGLRSRLCDNVVRVSLIEFNSRRLSVGKKNELSHNGSCCLRGILLLLLLLMMMMMMMMTLFFLLLLFFQSSCSCVCSSGSFSLLPPPPPSSSSPPPPPPSSS